MLDSTLLSVVAALITVIAGFFTNLIASKKTEQDKIQKEKVSDIANTVLAQAEEARAKAVSEIVKHLPKDQQTPEELQEAASKNLKIVGDLVINNQNAGDAELVQDLVTGYHQQALSQAKVQFWFSVAAATTGFGFIIYSASGITVENLASVLKILPGVIIDAVALLFFRQAEQTRERATALYDRLRTDNQMRNAKAIVESIEDIQIKSAVKAQMALHMAGLKPKEIDLPTFLTGKVSSEP
ncbi:hypothetical protein CWB99_10360 [Pseudoalteromonas rubra]|uniref:Cyanobacterial TRADD-N associated 2 transmembrane domain-containing protein n=1 Tax=Pseudoalteromonas rubra TaxID=43658 RepID=A0A5S3WMW7_9GAMM|nr:hypothetical protein [Pseudoalteromonas rubra]TMP26984.1 hypothetical protein CWC00_23715 [Pseudoalteromonas rubra]TMP29162.1 hypothetical protein CWB99_10360 [Pseudoalteromonas rubra]